MSTFFFLTFQAYLAILQILIGSTAKYTPATPLENNYDFSLISVFVIVGYAISPTRPLALASIKQIIKIYNKDDDASETPNSCVFWSPTF